MRAERLQARQIEDLLSGYGSVKSSNVIYSKVSALMEKASINSQKSDVKLENKYEKIMRRMKYSEDYKRRQKLDE